MWYVLFNGPVAVALRFDSFATHERVLTNFGRASLNDEDTNDSRMDAPRIEALERSISLPAGR